MPPHCDSLAGPVVSAAKEALELGAVDVVLPYVPESAEPEVLDAFRKTMDVRRLDPVARELADRWFFETVVRLHRAGEGAPYTGLKPAGLEIDPVVHVAERAFVTHDSRELIGLLSGAVGAEVEARLAHVLELKAWTNGHIEANREYVEAMLGFQVWAHAMHAAIHAHPHEHGRGASHEHLHASV